jgi:hypothetical protein
MSDDWPRPVATLIRSEQTGLMESRYRHPSKASRLAEEKRAARRDAHRRLGAFTGIASASAVAAALAAHAAVQWQSTRRADDR